MSFPLFSRAIVFLCFNMEYRLITAVSGFPCLYDRSSPTYRDLNMRGDAWREVSQLVGVNGERIAASRSPAVWFRSS